MVLIVSIKGTSNGQTDELATILNTDRKLRKKLGDGDKTISRSGFIEFNRNWAKKNNAEIFAITLNDKAIGLISLSRKSKKDTANIGYWIGSKYWNKGYTTEAFGQILKFAKGEGVKIVTCTIPKQNAESIAIWKKFDAVFENKGDKIVPLLYL